MKSGSLRKSKARLWLLLPSNYITKFEGRWTGCGYRWVMNESFWDLNGFTFELYSKLGRVMLETGNEALEVFKILAAWLSTSNSIRLHLLVFFRKIYKSKFWFEMRNSCFRCRHLSNVLRLRFTLMLGISISLRPLHLHFREHAT